MYTQGTLGGTGNDNSNTFGKNELYPSTEIPGKNQIVFQATHLRSVTSGAMLNADH